MSGPAPFDPSGASYAVLSVDDLSLLVPQRAVHALELALDVEPGGDSPSRIGWIWVERKQWPVFCLDANLEPLREPPPARKICAVLVLEAGGFGLLCDRIENLEHNSVRTFPIPGCMHDPDAPIDALAAFDGRIGCVLCVSGLGAVLSPQAGPMPEGYADTLVLA